MHNLYDKYEKFELQKFYEQMFLIREFEEVSAAMYLRGKISGFTHLYIGEEAVAVGAISALFNKDYVISAYRDHGHALAKGASPKEVMAELFGKDTGMCHGFGGSMHLYDQNIRFMGGYAIVGSEIPIASGIGLSIQYKDEDSICACFFGDGAVNEGAFHEGLNLAKLWNLPVMFICENNLYGMGTAVGRATSVTEIYKKAEAYGIPSKCVDGMDVLKVNREVSKAVKSIRKGNGPHFLEMKTYRYRAHSMADPGKYRTIIEEEIWRERDPIETFARQLIESGLFDVEELKEIKDKVKDEVDKAVKFADESPNPRTELLYDLVYAHE